MSAPRCGCGRHSGVCGVEPCCPRCPSREGQESWALLFFVAGLIVVMLVLSAVALPV